MPALTKTAPRGKGRKMKTHEQKLEIIRAHVLNLAQSTIQKSGKIGNVEKAWKEITGEKEA